MNDDFELPEEPLPPPPPEDDAVEHLWNAAQEFLKAMRALVDAADEFVDQQRHKSQAPKGGSSRLHHIDIDVS